MCALRLIWSVLLLVCLSSIATIAQETEKNEGNPPTEQELIDSSVPPVEVHVKDSKTQQSSTLFVHSNDRLFRELQDMKLALQQLQQTLDYLVNYVMADLEEENRQLKKTLQQYGIPLPTEKGIEPPISYVPGRNRQQTTVPLGDNESRRNLAEESKLPQKQPKKEPQEFYFRIIEEWGRSPEVTKQLDPNIPSVKGIVGVVPAGTSHEKLQELARELRTKYDEFDNINIEVFDDEQSARDFADKHIRDPEHNVMSISKHKKSGRDIITIHGITENLVP